MASHAARARHDHEPAAADDDDDTVYPSTRKANRERRAPDPRHAGRTPARRELRERGRRGPTRDARRGREEFKCRHCRAFIGPTVGGGRHRNHCPLCLHSRHVDAKRPGDRAGDCGAVMAPIGRFDRPNGEPMIIHECRGCGVLRHNRLAADDNPLALTRLPLVQPRLGGRARRGSVRSPEQGRGGGAGRRRPPPLPAAVASLDRAPARVPPAGNNSRSAIARRESASPIRALARTADCDPCGRALYWKVRFGQRM